MLRIGQIEGTATADKKYTDGSVAGGIAATRLRAAAFNAMQEELAHIVEEAGLTLDIDDMTQVLTGLRKLFLSRSDPFADIKSDGAPAVASALSNLGLADNTGFVGRLLGAPRIYTSSAIYTQTAGTRAVLVEAIGAGGGSSYVPAQGGTTTASASGGGGGSYAVAMFTSGFSGVSITIGGGGTAGLASGSVPPSAGGTTSFGSLLICPGGSQGAAISAGSTSSGLATGGSGGAQPTGGNIYSSRGGHGGHGFSLAGSLLGGCGGSNGKGGGGPSGIGQSNPGIAATTVGTGASGGAVSTNGAGVNGAAGAAGVIYIWEFS